MSLEEYLPKVEEPVLGLQAQLYPVICYCGSTLMYTPHQMVFCQYCRTWQHSVRILLLTKITWRLIILGAYLSLLDLKYSTV